MALDWSAYRLELFPRAPFSASPVSGLESTALLIHTESGPDLITGGAFGPEAGLIVFPHAGAWRLSGLSIYPESSAYPRRRGSLISRIDETVYFFGRKNNMRTN